MAYIREYPPGSDCNLIEASQWQKLYLIPISMHILVQSMKTSTFLTFHDMNLLKLGFTYSLLNRTSLLVLNFPALHKQIQIHIKRETLVPFVCINVGQYNFYIDNSLSTNIVNSTSPEQNSRPLTVVSISYPTKYMFFIFLQIDVVNIQ